MFSTLSFQYDLALSLHCTKARRKAALDVIEVANAALAAGYEPSSDEEEWDYLFFFERHWVGDF